MPVSFTHGAGPSLVRRFYAPKAGVQSFKVTGVTRDSTGAPLGLCEVRVFKQGGHPLGERLVGQDFQVGQIATDWVDTNSDANGNYSVTVYDQDLYFAVGFKQGAPEVDGVTVDTVQPV